ncbi:scarecrow-like protein 6 [Phalaenopsis equestris]|uniref:scarecrow-like protein 6 n=1 Tax=Phalaenopsis equestris TaxID=78828 RepID=UPI0009E22191|nr:scarecrow-like protein 6 [Phalaenopsis equestris]
MFFEEPVVEKSQFFCPDIPFNQHLLSEDSTNPAIFAPCPSFTPSQLLEQSLNFPQLQVFPYPQQQQQQVVVDVLYKAAELVEAGNFVGAHVILARLNHHLPSPIGKPLFRSAFYFKEALQFFVNSVNPQAATFSPLDAVIKLSAYKAFSEVSPIPQFTCFTATQALLEELGTANCIHIIDFDISFGGQWSSFLQELAQRRSPRILLLKITALVSPSAFHPLELHLTRENLCRFAADLNIPFEIRFTNIEAFDPAEILALSAGTNESIAVNLPVDAWQGPSFPTLLRLVKQLLPKIVISVDHGFGRNDLPFSHHFLHALQSCAIFLDSIDAAGIDLDVVNKIEKFVLQPKIENCINRHHCAAEKILPWPTQFESAGFKPVQFSSFTEMQAECLLKRLQVKGFHVEKRQASLYLHWKRGELASVSVWKS